MKNRTIFYNQSAEKWTDALPLGNGRLGVMLYGGETAEQLQLNEETLWSGFYDEYADNPTCAENLTEMRRLLFEGKISECEALASKHLVCRGSGSKQKDGEPWAYGSYQTAGRYFADFMHGDVSSYRRELDISTGIAKVSYTADGQNFMREAFVSMTEPVIALKLSSDRKFSAVLSYQREDVTVTAQDGMFLVNGGFDGERGIRYSLAIKHVTDGILTESDGKYRLSDATRCEVYIAIATTYAENTDTETTVCSRVHNGAAIGFDALLDASSAIFSELMNRTELQLDGEASDFPTDLRLHQLREGKITESDLRALIETYFNFGRYLNIASSYQSVLPANLQGIWAEDYKVIWSADYHININIQMNYWLTETTDLPECTDAFLRYIKMIAESGRRTAKIQYNCGGWVAHTITNPWGFTAPGEGVSWGSFMCAGAWCCAHIWEHWLFGRDVAFLREYYPVMRGACEFFLDFLCEDPRTGYLVTAPSNSPENHYRDPMSGKTVAICAGPTMDNSILYELFTNTAAAAEILGIDGDFAGEVLKKRDRLPPLSIGKHGQIMEWQEDFEETEPGHRHLSMLYALHPGSQITKDRTPALFEAAKTSIARRLSAGGGHTGWSRAWIINFYARLGMGDECLDHITALLQKSTYDNLFDSHPPFQIDGNFGGTAGVAEMLVQSHDGLIDILPALPSKWRQGRVRGLTARGGFAVDVEWRDGRASAVTVTSRLGEPCRFRANGVVYTPSIRKGERIRFDVV